MQQSLILRENYNVGGREAWMPDAGIYKYVQDMLEDRFGLDTSAFPDYWLPIGIVGTMDWVFISGWWLMCYTGMYESNDQYEKLYSFNGYEFDPDQLLIFREHPELNRFEERFVSPGITDHERSEVIQWLSQQVYQKWGKEAPPQEVMEYIVYSTFMWILSDFGKEWIRTLDPIFHCIYDFSVAYLSEWDNDLLNPTEVICTERPINSCKDCGNVLWCSTQGYALYDDNGTAVFQYMCSHCATGRAAEGRQVDSMDTRLQEPLCVKCTYTKCPHLDKTQEDVVWDKMRDIGSRRMSSYYEEMERMEGRTPRQVAGQTVEDIIDFFK